MTRNANGQITPESVNENVIDEDKVRLYFHKVLMDWTLGYHLTLEHRDSLLDGLNDGEKYLVMYQMKTHLLNLREAILSTLNDGVNENKN